jgi:transcriptional regulator with XRE-family HTH domain
MAMKAIEFAKRLGVDKATISRWENGKENPSDPADRAIRLAYAARMGYFQESKQLFEEVFPEIDPHLPSVLIFIAADKKGKFSCVRECR